MIYHILLYLKNVHQTFIPFAHLFHYISVRSLAALLTTLILAFIAGDWFIAFSQRHFRSASRNYLPDNHRAAKDNSPTMGGIFILSTVIIAVMLWGDLSKPYLWLCILNLVLFGAIGLWDDFNKINKRAGIPALTKFLLQIGASLLVIGLWIVYENPDTSVWFPFFKNVHPDLGWLFIAWAALVMVGTSNAVNITDGLDGLATTSLITTFGTFTVIGYLVSNMLLASYLHLPYAPVPELAIIGSALLGACLGFLWYNAYPAAIFMGDVGSLALGSTLALIALMAKQELLLIIAGGLFMIETLSVIAQVISFKVRGKRLFKMAPIHHHFEILGWPESKIVVRFAIISLILALVTLLTLKIR